MLKNFINEQSVKNKKLLTKQLRMRKAVELAAKYIEEAKNAKLAPPRTSNAPARASDLESQFKEIVSSSNVIKSTKPPSATKNKVMSICACGEPNPEHRGYCINCVKKLKARFDSLILAYESVKEEYDGFNAIDVEKANEKLKLMKAKAD